jgi:hypothetical protein
MCHVLNKPPPRFTSTSHNHGRFRRKFSSPPACLATTAASCVATIKTAAKAVLVTPLWPLASCLWPLASRLLPNQAPCKCSTSFACVANFPLWLTSRAGTRVRYLPAADRTSCPSVLPLVDSRLHMIQMLEDDPVRIPHLQKAACASIPPSGRYLGRCPVASWVRGPVRQIADPRRPPGCPLRLHIKPALSSCT